MFCPPGLIVVSIVGVVSSFSVLRIRTRFHLLRSRIHYRRNRGRRVPFSCFALPDSFSEVPRASDPVFMFCASGPVCMSCDLRRIFGGTEGVTRFHVLRSRIRFRRYRRRQVQFSCFALKDPFSAVTTASGPVFMFCAPGLIFGGNEGIRYHFHVLRSRTHFRLYKGRRVPLSYFTLPGSFSAGPRASGPVFIFCAPAPIFGGTEGVGSRFHVLRCRTNFRLCTEGVRSRFHILRSRNHFRRYRWCWVSFSCFVFSKSLSAVLRASCPVSCFALQDTFSVIPTA
jgi:hypothetical protein